MATYYKYAERNASSDVNWAEISKNLTDTLKEENRIRVEKKAAIDEASRLYGETLSNAPTGDSKEMREWALNFANNAQEARLLQDRLLKSGQLKLKDYTVMRQNLTDGTNSAFSLAEEYQKEYKEKWDRANATDPAKRSQALERFYMSQAEGFANFTQTNLYINPTNYKVSVGKMYKDSDGVYKMSENPNDFVTVNDLRNRMKEKFDYFDYDKTITQWVGGLGKYSEVVNAAGGWKVITDPALRDRLDPATKKSVNELMLAMDNELKSYIFSNPYNGSSLLTEDIGVIDGKAVDFTFDPAEAAKNKNLILLKPNPRNPNGPAIPEFSKEQQDIMLNFMKTQATVKLEHAEEYKQKTQYFTPEYVYKRGDKEKEEQAKARAWNGIFSATTDSDKNAYAQYIIGLPENVNSTNPIIAFDFSEVGKLKVKYKNSDADREIPIPQTLDEWSRIGTEFTGITDANKIFELSGGGDRKSGLKGDIRKATAERAMAKGGTEADSYPTVNSKVEQSFAEDSPTEMANNLTETFRGSGLSFSPKSSWGSDYVIVKKGGVVIGEYNVDNSDELILMSSDIDSNLDDTYRRGLTQESKPKPTGGASNSGGNPRGG